MQPAERGGEAHAFENLPRVDGWMDCRKNSETSIAIGDDFRRDYIQRALLETNGDYVEAARLAELSDSYFRRLAQSLGVDVL